MMSGKKDESLKGVKGDQKKTAAAGVQTRGGGRQPYSPGSRELPKTPDKTPTKPTPASVSENIAKILSKLDTLDTKIETTNTQVREGFEGNNEKTDRLSEDCAKVKVTTDGLKTQVTVHGTRLTDLEAKVEQLERERRKTTLVIDGVEEEDDDLQENES